MELCGLFGALLGDGSSGRYFAKGKNCFIYPTTIVGNASKDADFVKQLSCILESYFNVKPYIRVARDNSIRLTVNSRLFFEWLKRNGYPIGKKPSDFGLTQEILRLPDKNINRIIRGLLDTDVHINSRKDEDFKYPYVTITSISPVLRSQLKEILRRQGIPAFIHAEAVSVRGISNFNKWFELIGSSNPRILSKYEEFCKTGKILPGL